MSKNKLKKPTWKNVKSKISKLDNPELIHLIQDLYNLSQDNKDFLNARLSLMDNSIRPYKDIVKDCLYPDVMENEDFEYDKAEKAIQRYKIAAGDTEGIADLMIYFVECGNQFTLDYGDIDEVFYDTLIEMYEKAVLKVIGLPQKKQNKFRERLRAIMESSDGIGWGYHDDLCHYYYESFKDK